MEMFFEEFNFVATFFPPTAMVGAFCYGKPTGLVVDLGASHITVSPVVDGYVLEKAVTTTTRGGDWLDSQIRQVLSSSQVTVMPWYDNAKYSVQNVIAPASFRNFHVGEIMRDLKHWMCFVSATAISSEIIAGPTPAHPRVPYMPVYELPDGTTVTASDSLCLVTERLFLPGRVRGMPAPPGMVRNQSSGSVSGATPAARTVEAGILSAPLMPGVPTHAQIVDVDPARDPLHDLIYASIARCDADCRKEMVSNVMLIGGGSLMDGLQARLSTELTSMLPAHLKVIYDHQYLWSLKAFCTPSSRRFQQNFL